MLDFTGVARVHWSSGVVIRECKCTQKRLCSTGVGLCQLSGPLFSADLVALKCDRNFFLSASACDNKVPVHKAQVLDNGLCQVFCFYISQCKCMC